MPWIEQLARRTRTSKTRRLYVDGQPTQKFSWDGQLGTSMHYLDAGGAWQDVDADAEEADSDGFTVKFTKLSYFGRVDNEGRRRFYPDRNDLSYWIEFKKPYPNMGAPTRQNRWFYWDFTHAVIGVRFDIDSLKFGFRLKDDQAPTSITIPFETQGITRQGRLLYHDGEVVAELRKPIATGSNLDEFGHSVQKVCNVSFGPGEVTISLDPSGLEYPIDIDPTVDKQIAATADDGRRYTGALGFSTTDTWPRLGYATHSSYLHQHAFFRWGGVSIEGTIDVAYMELYRHDTGTGSPAFKVYGVDEDNPAAPTSAAEFDADPLTDAAVDWDGAWGAGWNQSPSLVGVFQELVDAYTISNDAVMVQVKNDAGAVQSYNWWVDYSDDPAEAAKLHIEYEAAGPQILEPSAIASLEAFGGHEVNFTMFPSAIASAEAIGAHTVVWDQFVNPSAIGSLEAFGTTKFNFTVFPSALATAEAFGTAKVNLALALTGIGSLEAFGTAILLMTQFLGPTAIASLEVFGMAQLNLELILSAIASAEAFGSAQINLILLPAAIASLEAFGNAQVNLILLPSGIASAEAFGLPTVILMLTFIQPPGIPSAEAFGLAVIVGGEAPMERIRKWLVSRPRLIRRQ